MMDKSIYLTVEEHWRAGVFKEHHQSRHTQFARNNTSQSVLLILDRSDETGHVRYNRATEYAGISAQAVYNMRELNEKLKVHLEWSNSKTMRTLGRKSAVQLLQEKLAAWLPAPEPPQSGAFSTSPTAPFQRLPIAIDTILFIFYSFMGHIYW